jgi:signal peptidase I
VFVSPYQADEAERGNDPTPTLVKRVWGTPGDTLYLRDGLLDIDGIPQPQGYLAQQNPKGDPTEVSELFAWQRQYALASSRFGPAPLQPTHDNWGPIVIPAGHYFMLGDNRYNSKDSRYWGIVPRANLRGRPLFVYYSYNADDSDRALPFITDIRWGRIGHTIK